MGNIEPCKHSSVCFFTMCFKGRHIAHKETVNIIHYDLHILFDREPDPKKYLMYDSVFGSSNVGSSGTFTVKTCSKKHIPTKSELAG